MTIIFKIANCYTVFQIPSITRWSFHTSSFLSLLCSIFSSDIYWGTQFNSIIQSCLTLVTPWTAAHQASLSITNSWSLLKLMSIKSVVLSNHLCHPLLLSPSIIPSIRVFSNESALRIRWPKYWSFSFNISPSNEHPGLISFRLNWLDLLAVQGPLKILLQHQNSKASIPWHSAFFFFFFNFIFKLYIIVLVLPNIKMNLPQVYMCSPSWALLPPPSPFQLSL